MSLRKATLLALIAAPLVASFVNPTPLRRLVALQSTVDEEQNAFLEIATNPSTLEFTPRQYFYGRATVELGMGWKPITEQFSPSFKDDKCALAVVEMDMPLGMVIEESGTLPGRIEVIEVVPGSNSEKAGVKVGDVVRAMTAQKSDAMAAAEGNIAFNALAGATTSGVKVMKAIYIADGRPFDGAMEALMTNTEAKGGSGRVAVVFERETKEAEAASA